MLNFIQEDAPALKRVKFYSLPMILKYLFIRYQVFVTEMGRPVIGEFYKDDLLAQHYVLKEKDNIIGTLRILYAEDKIAIIGRVAILKKYRKQGYGTWIINKTIELIKLQNQANVIKLFTEEEKIGFYKKFGFLEKGKVYFSGVPYVQMISTI